MSISFTLVALAAALISLNEQSLGLGICRFLTDKSPNIDKFSSIEHIFLVIQNLINLEIPTGQLGLGI